MQQNKRDEHLITSNISHPLNVELTAIMKNVPCSQRIGERSVPSGAMNLTLTAETN